MSDYYADLHRVFRHHWAAVLQDYGPETAHDLRVNLKRQMAFFRLLETLDGHFSAQAAADTFHELYRLAGKVRNRQVELALIKKYDASVFLSHWLLDKEQRHRQVLQAKEQELGLDYLDTQAKLVQQHIVCIPEREIPVGLRRYFHAIISRLEVFSGEVPDWHALRKLIKELFYNWSFVFEDTLRDPALGWLDELQELLGKWHDHDFTLQHMAKQRGHKVMELKQVLIQRQAKLEQGLDMAITTLPQIRERLHQLLSAW
jgi:CHAD domain-containing protein